MRGAFAILQPGDIISKLGKMHLERRGGRSKRTLGGLYAWAKLKLSPPPVKLSTDQATRSVLANEAPSIWFARHYQRKLKNRRMGWRGKYQQRMQKYGLHVPADDAAVDSLTNFADNTFNWESQSGGEETTKPHYH